MVARLACLLLLLGVFGGASVVAQTHAAPEPLPLESDRLITPEVPVDPTPGAASGAEEEERQLPVLRRPTAVAPQTITDGTNGDIFLNSPAPYGTSGVLLQSQSGYPNIAAKLGTATSSASFSVFDSADQSLFIVRGDGRVGIGTTAPSQALHVDDDVQGVARVRINNPNSGSSSLTTGAGIMLTEGATTKAGLISLGSASTSGVGGANALQVWNSAAGAMVFGTSGIERMRIHANGNVGVGTTAASSRFYSATSQDAAIALYGYASTTVEQAAAQHDTAAYLLAHQNVLAGVTNTGSSLGARIRGYLTGDGVLTETNAILVDSGVFTGHAGTVTRATGIRVNVQKGGGAITTGYGIYIEPVEAATPYAFYQTGTADTNYFAGNVSIGTATPPADVKLNVVGNAKVSGEIAVNSITSTTGIKAVYQDLAEWVPSSVDVPAGTVVVLDPAQTNQIMPSSSAYDTAVAGVVSENPGVLLGVGAPNKEMVATTGRVKVRVDARQSPIRVGDLLVTSDMPGTAMRSEPLDLAGQKLHRPGTIIGKALEPLAGGMGEILVLLSMQ